MKDGFNPEMLVLARESREMTQLQLSEKTKIPQTLLSRMESGLLQPNEEQVISLEQELKYPQDFFYQSDRIFGFNASVFYHRKRSDVPSRILKKLHSVINLSRMRIQRLTRSVELDVDNPLIQLSPLEHGGVEEVAQLVRSLMRLPEGPVRDLSAALEDAGVVIVQYSFGTSKVDAISEWIPGYPPIILINTDHNVSGDRYRWNLAHELGHLVMHRYPSTDMEGEANRFAAEFLLPERQIKPQLRSVRINKLALLKQHWKVSMGALLERARQLGCITVSQYKYMRMNFSRLGYNKREPIETDIAIEKCSLLSELITTHVNGLRYSISELARLLVMNMDECAASYLPSQSVGGLRLISGSVPQLA
ncbi:MAG: ImmA/IrrE family metallo-endopeptidase [Acidobacteria bacterium]|nr:ImmA/IrrE family metallo-endopeptidase [Acidobacteriota bacterium]